MVLEKRFNVIYYQSMQRKWKEWNSLCYRQPKNLIEICHETSYALRKGNRIVSPVQLELRKKLKSEYPLPPSL